MAIYVGLSNNKYQIKDTPFASGGEGDIFDVLGMPNMVAKIYRPDKQTTERQRKLSAMVKIKPNVEQQFSWPQDVLLNNGKFVGYVMPKIVGKEKLRNIYVYDNRRGKPWTLYIAIAKNLSSAVHNVHEIGQVIGDLNPENILVNPKTGLLTLVDTDSYHITEANGTIHRCGVGMPEYIAPELQGKHFQSAPFPTFTRETDLFSLAVLLFSLLMNGAHPFACKTISGSSSKFQPIDNLSSGTCAYFAESIAPNIEIPRYAPDLDSLPKELQELFKRSFVNGHRNPRLRPTAEEYYFALEKLERNIKVCGVSSEHQYYYHAVACPWCKVDQKMKSIGQSAFNAGAMPSGSGSQTSVLANQTKQPTGYTFRPSLALSNRLKIKNWWKPVAGFAVVIIAIIIIASSISGRRTNNNVAYTTTSLTATTTTNSDDKYTTVTSPYNSPSESTDQSYSSFEVQASNITSVVKNYERENNDRPDIANALEINQLIYGHLSGTYKSERDWFKFTVPKDQYAIITLDTINQNSNSYFWDMYVYTKAEISSINSSAGLALQGAATAWGADPFERLHPTFHQFIKGDESTTITSPFSEGDYFIRLESSNEHSTDEYCLLITLVNDSVKNTTFDETAYEESIISFGDYEWLILDVIDGNALILSIDIVAEKQFHFEQTDVIWENCSLREYLNSEFFYSFSKEEQDVFQKSQIRNELGESGYEDETDVMDWFFILNRNEVKKYFIDNELGFSKLQIGGSGEWWNRDVGNFTADGARFASVNMSEYLSSRGVRITESRGVRPACWIILDNAISSSVITTKSKISTALSTPFAELPSTTQVLNENNQRITQGDYIYLGMYEQDNNINNGYEPIIWKVLHVDGQNVLLLCERIIDLVTQPNTTSYSWEESKAREWCISVYNRKIFSDLEKSFIMSKQLDGNIYSDNLFLLSYEEMTNPAFGFEPNKNDDINRTCEISKYVKENYSSESNVTGNGLIAGITYYNYATGNYWLRDGFEWGEGQNGYGVYCVGDGDGYIGSCPNLYRVSTRYGIRPAIYVDATKFRIKNGQGIHEFPYTLDGIS